MSTISTDFNSLHTSDIHGTLSDFETKDNNSHISAVELRNFLKNSEVVKDNKKNIAGRIIKIVDETLNETLNETVNETVNESFNEAVNEAVKKAQDVYTNKIKPIDKKSSRWRICEVATSIFKLAVAIAFLYRTVVATVAFYYVFTGAASVSSIALPSIILLGVLGGYLALVLLKYGISRQNAKLIDQMIYLSYNIHSVNLLKNLLTEIRDNKTFNITDDKIYALIADTALHEKLSDLLRESKKAMEYRLFNDCIIKNNICYTLKNNKDGIEEEVKHEAYTKMLNNLSAAYQEFYTKLLSEFNLNEVDINAKTKRANENYINIIDNSIDNSDGRYEPINIITSAIFESIQENNDTVDSPPDAQNTVDFTEVQ